MLVAYPIPGNRKSLSICEHFTAQGRGTVALDGRLRPGDAFFYGVDSQIEHIWHAVIADPARRYFYADNSYFDPTRQKYFRVTKGGLQHPGIGSSSGARFKNLKIPVKPWRSATPNSAPIVICEQSSSFMRMPAGYGPAWLDDTLHNLYTYDRQHRPIQVRPWDRDKALQSASLPEQLAGAHCLITYSSTAAITALIAGIPVISGGAAKPLSGSIFDLENLPMGTDRERLFGILADNQFTLEEMRNGYAWQRLVQHSR